MDQLKSMLEAHNWNYMYADMGGFDKGRKERKAIDKKVDELIEQGVSRRVIDMLWASTNRKAA